jgi:glycosyltransferase involved in cell wall biosynthesis
MTKILYIGNDLSKKSKYQSTMATLSGLLEMEEFHVYRASSLNNKTLRMLEMLWTVFNLKNQVQFILIDTYSTSNFYFAFLTSQLARLLRKKYIPILHGGDLPKRLDRNPLLSKMIFKNSFTNVAPSGYLQFEFEKRDYPTIFIPNILNISTYTFKKRSQLQPKLLWVRAFAHLYNPKMAIQVLNQLKPVYPDATLCMVGPDKGDGSYQDTQALVAQLKLSDSVTFTGVLPKEQWHALSVDYDIFINTTTIDNTPVSVMEAMALGLPIISTNVGGIPYLINDGEDGLLVNNADVIGMTQAVERLIHERQMVEMMTIYARKKAESFDWRVVREQWMSVLS